MDQLEVNPNEKETPLAFINLCTGKIDYVFV